MSDITIEITGLKALTPAFIDLTDTPSYYTDGKFFKVSNNAIVYTDVNWENIQGDIDDNETLAEYIDDVATTKSNTAVTTHNSSATAHTDLRSAINTEIQNRLSADTTLQNNINSEATTRATNDTTLQTNINSEASTRLQNDTLLQSNINTLNSDLTAHKNDSDNPHSVTKTQVGLGNCDNTSDINKPISTATQTALDTKVNKNNDITGATHTKITYDSKGLVTGGSDIVLTDVTDITATANELNILDGITATTQELNYVDGVTSSIQEQLDTKVIKNNNITSGTHTKITYDTKGLVTGGTDLSESDIPNLHLNKIIDITATANEVNILDGATLTTSELNTLDGITATTQELNYTDGVTSAIQPQINSKIFISDIVNNVSSSDTDKPLSALQGKELSDRIANIANIGRYLSNWNCTTGLPDTEPQTIPYAYTSGMYFVIGTVGTTNYRPSGSSYTGVASTTVETQTVKVGDFYTYDGTQWLLRENTGAITAFANIAGSPYDNSNLASALNNKVTINSTIAGGTFPKITFDSKGLVTAGASLVESDIPSLHLNKISDITATASEVNVLDGITATTTELNYTDGVTSNIQTQLNSKQATITGGATTITSSNLTTSRALVSDANGKVGVSDITSTELGYLDGVTSSVQTQLNAKEALANVTSKGNTTTPVYFDSNGVATVITSYGGNSATATKATQDASGNVITTTYATKTELTNATLSMTYTSNSKNLTFSYGS